MLSAYFGSSAAQMSVLWLVMLVFLPLWANKWLLPLMLLLASPAWIWLLIGLFAGGVLSKNWAFALAGAGGGFLLGLLMDITGLRRYVLARGGSGVPPRWRVWVCAAAGGCAGWLLSLFTGAEVSPGKMSFLIAGGVLLGSLVGSLVGPLNAQNSARRHGKARGKRRSGDR